MFVLTRAVTLYGQLGAGLFALARWFRLTAAGEHCPFGGLWMQGEN